MHWTRLARASDAARLLAFAAGLVDEASAAAATGGGAAAKTAPLGVRGLTPLDAARLRGLHAEANARFDPQCEVERFAARAAAIAAREAGDAGGAGGSSNSGGALPVIVDVGTYDIEVSNGGGAPPVIVDVGTSNKDDEGGAHELGGALEKESAEQSSTMTATLTWLTSTICVNGADPEGRPESGDVGAVVGVPGAAPLPQLLEAAAAETVVHADLSAELRGGRNAGPSEPLRVDMAWAIMAGATLVMSCDLDGTIDREKRGGRDASQVALSASALAGVCDGFEPPPVWNLSVSPMAIAESIAHHVLNNTSSCGTLERSLEADDAGALVLHAFYFRDAKEERTMKEGGVSSSEVEDIDDDHGQRLELALVAGTLMVLFPFSLVIVVLPVALLVTFGVCGATGAIRAMLGGDDDARRTRKPEIVMSEDFYATRGFSMGLCYCLVLLFAAIAAGLAGNGAAAEAGAYSVDDDGDNPAHIVLAMLSVAAGVGMCCIFAEIGSREAETPDSKFAVARAFHRIFVPVLALCALWATLQYTDKVSDFVVPTPSPVVGVVRLDVTCSCVPFRDGDMSCNYFSDSSDSWDTCTNGGWSSFCYYECDTPTPTSAPSLPPPSPAPTAEFGPTSITTSSASGWYDADDDTPDNDNAYNDDAPDEAALGMAWAATVMALILACCGCCCYYIVPQVTGE